MKQNHRLWHGRLWIILSLVIASVLFLAISLRPKKILQNIKIEKIN